MENSAQVRHLRELMVLSRGERRARYSFERAKQAEPTIQHLSAGGTSQEDGAEQVVHAELSESFAVNPTGAPSQRADDAHDSDGIEMTATAERAAMRIARSRAESEHLYV